MIAKCDECGRHDWREMSAPEAQMVIGADDDFRAGLDYMLTMAEPGEVLRYWLCRCGVLGVQLCAPYHA